MSQLLQVDAGKKNEILATAIEKAMICVLTRRTQDGWQTFKSKLLADPYDGERLLIETPRAHGNGADITFTNGERFGVTFRRGHKKCMFASAIVSQGIGSFEVGEAEIPYIELQWPEMLQELQRRAYYRVSPTGRAVRVRFWAGGVIARANAESDSQSSGVVTGILQDISAGGMRVCTTDVAPDDFTDGEPVGCAFTPKPRGETLILDAVFRHYQPTSGGASIGLQFVGFEATERGRDMLAKLARVVTDYQRRQARD